MPPKPVKRHHKTLIVVKKLELIGELEEGTSVSKLCEEYGVAKHTVSHINKAKPKLFEYAAQYYVDALGSKSGSEL